MNPDYVDGIKWYLAFLVSTACHEAAHAWSAQRLGDDTAALGGQTSLNPAVHIRREPFGMVVVPILSYVLGGWMVGWASAPYNRNWAAMYPRRAGAMALAGPAANLVLLLVAALLCRVGWEWGVFRPSPHAGMLRIVTGIGPSDGGWAFVAKMVSVFFSLNLLLFTFNLLPVPPLDGSAAPLLVLPPHWADKYQALLQQPAWAWMGLLLAWKLSDIVFPVVFSAATNVLYSTMSLR